MNALRELVYEIFIETFYWKKKLIFFFFFVDKLYIWSLSFTLDLNLIPNLSIVSNWSLTFQYRVNLILAVI